VGVLNNPCAFGDEFRFEVTFDCLAALSDGMRVRTRSALRACRALCVLHHRTTYRAVRARAVQTWSGV
ncbi:hypothetical protein EON67_02055, partial [archaeon]